MNPQSGRKVVVEIAVKIVIGIVGSATAGVLATRLQRVIPSPTVVDIFQLTIAELFTFVLAIVVAFLALVPGFLVVRFLCVSLLLAGLAFGFTSHFAILPREAWWLLIPLGPVNAGLILATYALGRHFERLGRTRDVETGKHQKGYVGFMTQVVAPILGWFWLLAVGGAYWGGLTLWGMRTAGSTWKAASLWAVTAFVLVLIMSGGGLRVLLALLHARGEPESKVDGQLENSG